MTIKKFCKDTFNSPILSGILLAVVLLLIVVWRTANAGLIPPSVEGYNWREHPNTLMIFYRGDCCGLPVSAWVEEGLGRKLDVLVVSDRSRAELNDLKKQFSSDRLVVVNNLDRETMIQFAPDEKTVALRVKDGTITRKGVAVSPLAFLGKFTSGR